MSRIQNPPLRTQRLSNGSRQLLHPLVVDVSGTTTPQLVTVPAGPPPTDYSSLPWGFRWLINWSRVDVAGVVHDHLYKQYPLDPRFPSRWDMDLAWFRIATSGQHRANCIQAALGLAGIVLGGWWVIRTRCTWRHIALSLFIDAVFAGGLVWLSFIVGKQTGSLVLVLLVVVVFAANLWQRRP